MSIDTEAELRERVEHWRRHGNDGTGLMVNICVLEELLRRPDLTPEQCAVAADAIEEHWTEHYRWRDKDDPVLAEGASLSPIESALRAAADGRTR